jgi:hypothetical protein
MTPQQALHEQAMCERTSGKLLTEYVHQTQVTDRSRVLGRALWEAGCAYSWGVIAEKLQDQIREKPRGTRR